MWSHLHTEGTRIDECRCRRIYRQTQPSFQIHDQTPEADCHLCMCGTLEQLFICLRRWERYEGVKLSVSFRKNNSFRQEPLLCWELVGDAWNTSPDGIRRLLHGHRDPMKEYWVIPCGCHRTTNVIITANPRLCLNSTCCANKLTLKSVTHAKIVFSVTGSISKHREGKNTWQNLQLRFLLWEGKKWWVTANGN